MKPELSVTEASDRIMTRFAEDAPESHRLMGPPATDQDLRAAELAIGVSWPAQLREWYRLCDGAEARASLTWRKLPVHEALPGYRQFPVKQVISTWQMWQNVMAEFYTLDELRSRREDDAGSMAHAFLPEYIPIAGNGGGNYLFVDTRPERLSGCVTEYAHGDADSRGMLWTSVADMLTDVAHAIERGTASYNRVPVVEEQCLMWLSEDMAPGT